MFTITSAAQGVTAASAVSVIWNDDLNCWSCSAGAPDYYIRNAVECVKAPKGAYRVEVHGAANLGGEDGTEDLPGTPSKEQHEITVGAGGLAKALEALLASFYQDPGRDYLIHFLVVTPA